MLATGSSVNQVLEPLFSGSVWGAGWYNAPTSAHYADAAIHYEGSVDFEMQGSSDVWDLIANWAINTRAYSKSLDISPDGARVYQYYNSGDYPGSETYDNTGAWCSELSLNTAEGSFVTGSLGVWALQRDEVDPAGGHAYSDYTYIEQKEGVVGGVPATFSATNPLNPGGANVDPIPFWRTDADLLRGAYSAPFTGGVAPQSNLETVEWSVTLSNGLIPLYTCSGSRLPTAILQGPIDGSGSVTLYHTDGVFDPILGADGVSGTLTSPYMYAENTWFRVSIRTNATAPATYVYIEMPAVVVSGDDYGIRGQADVTNRSFDLRALGGRIATYVLPPVLMSDSNGAYVAP